VGRPLSKHAIWTGLWFISIVCAVLIGLACVTHAALAQATPPPRPTPTGSDQGTPARSTPTPLGTPGSDGTPVRHTPTSIGTPGSNGTPMRPTPTASTVVPPTARPKPEKDQPEATPLPTPYLLPVTGVGRNTGTHSLTGLIVLTALGLVSCGLGVLLYRWRQHHRA
jgi:hypothetical protein